jgi:hypothetical protein
MHQNKVYQQFVVCTIPSNLNEVVLNNKLTDGQTLLPQHLPTVYIYTNATSNWRRLSIQSCITEPFKPQWKLYIPPDLTFINSAFANRVHLCVSCRSHNKQRLFPYQLTSEVWCSL